MFCFVPILVLCALSSPAVALGRGDDHDVKASLRSPLNATESAILSGGSFHEVSSKPFDCPANNYGVAEVLGHSGWFVDGLQFVYWDRSLTQLVGHSRATYHSLLLAPDEYIDEVIVKTGYRGTSEKGVRWGKGVTSLQFHTNKGHLSPLFGYHVQGSTTRVLRGYGKALLGMRGTVGDLIDTFEPIWGAACSWTCPGGDNDLLSQMI